MNYYLKGSDIWQELCVYALHAPLLESRSTHRESLYCMMKTVEFVYAHYSTSKPLPKLPTDKALDLTRRWPLLSVGGLFYETASRIPHLYFVEHILYY